MTDQAIHHVAIVSFEGAVKREAKRVREYLARDETLNGMKLTIEISGRTGDGDFKLEYSLGNEYGGGLVRGDGLNAVLDEFMRRRGWSAQHEAKALVYHKIPGDDTDDAPAPDDGILL